MLGAAVTAALFRSGKRKRRADENNRTTLTGDINLVMAPAAEERETISHGRWPEKRINGLPDSFRNNPPFTLHPPGVTAASLSGRRAPFHSGRHPLIHATLKPHQRRHHRTILYKPPATVASSRRSSPFLHKTGGMLEGCCGGGCSIRSRV